MIKYCVLIFVALFAFGHPSQAQLSEPLPFMTPSSPVAARIVDYEMKDTVTAPAALIRLPNRKIAYMVRLNGRLAPFFLKAIETLFCTDCKHWLPHRLCCFFRFLLQKSFDRK